MELLDVNIQLGKNISVGRMVKVRTTDGRRISLEDGVPWMILFICTRSLDIW